MKITVEIDSKEIVDLVLVVQDQPETTETIKNSLGEEIEVCLNEKPVKTALPPIEILAKIIRDVFKDNSSKEEKK